MKTLLAIRSSIQSGEGHSSRLADQFVARWRAAHPGGRVIVRDLAKAPVPHLDADRFGAFIARPDERTAEQIAAVGCSDALVAEVKSADVVVLAVPLYNFGIPSTLKAYFDHIARAGVTFRYTDKGPVGLLTGKQAVVFATRGGRYAGTALDSQTPYLRAFLGFVGITDVEFVYAEGLAISEVAREAALAGARSRIDELLSPQLRAA
jgi:FMN-dependent NADH-azoreductase